MIGIYKITSPSGRVYIGQSVNIKKRFYNYKLMHCKQQIKLYNSFKKYGVESHNFEIIKLCLVRQLNGWERYYQEKYDSVENGLNCRLTNSNDKSGKLSNETKSKMSKAQKTRFKNNAHHMKGVPKSNEQIEKTRKALTGKKLSREHIKKLSESHKGKQTGENHPFSKTLLHLDYGIFYFSINEAADSLGVKRTTLNAQLSGQNKLRYNILVL